MSKDLLTLYAADVLDEHYKLTLAQLCRTCHLAPEQVFELVEYGIVEPHGNRPTHWRFSGIALTRIHRARRLEQDLGLNTAGVALVLDLLDELQQLRARIRRLEGADD
ncbi:MerR family transcriptional regulator [Shewanella yunxiaonensis]|uniref:MerR family transcriptional regulator n=1 Tax=Shewanella yunxiaonensis TaxID=2829809 RepID=A0ABX7YRG6_9GAMM|nr:MULTISPECIES: chaperone modulator CbpM [Shewanella]MDF0535878.1 chaperone modulator CbpM [Shewanella sp. A32]QUN05327.1 MerR family transcriptional regulator [Shewanella yunxiaonensis]